MQSITTTDYKAKLTTLFTDFCKKATTAVTGGNYAGAVALVDGARELVVALQGQPTPRRAGRPRKQVAAASETTQEMNDEQFIAWLETQASPVPAAIALTKTGWTFNRLNLRGGVLAKSGKIAIDGRGKNKIFRTIPQREQTQQAA